MNRKEDLVSKMVLIRLTLSGALVGVAVAESFGLSNGFHTQLVAGSLGAISVGVLKFAHFI